ncbi:hypothetical protein LJC60_08175 [Ruminococcaceae bacterium OttesenSCG-928-D13]|nr:hypothetical protein [Ruminococcaceae bacterium OttesenSCG-928-D13]
MEKMIPNTTATTATATKPAPTTTPAPAKTTENKTPAPKITFGLLKEVPIEEVWNDKDGTFADWFAENVQMLDSALGMTFTDVEKIGKGDFTATAGKRKVLIETQLGQTNHHNLGRLLAHATEHAANVAVWVVANARSEHKATVHWMNANGVALYLVELHTYKVGNETMAANFEVIEKP